MVWVYVIAVQNWNMLTVSSYTVATTRQYNYDSLLKRLQKMAEYSFSAALLTFIN